MWVFEEECTLPKDSSHAKTRPELIGKPQKLSYLINELHENVKYLPDIPLPKNIIANPDSADAVKDATILIFNLPHQFFGKVCEGLKGKVMPYARALSGANIATEIAQGKFSETTVAYGAPEVDSKENAPKTAEFDFDWYCLVSDVAGVSLGGALKNVVALAAGFVDGLGWGDNAKAAVMRVGILEEVKFGQKFFSDSVKVETFTEESCGVADMITSCMGGRNFRCAKMSVAEGKPINEIEKRELNGQKLQGTDTAYEVNAFLKSRGMEKEFPLFTAVYDILKGNKKPEDIPQLLAQ
ncbi:hypothetical protein MRB53_037266 [Persea americana]|nr:hypothetical protein MRB53_037266 [Persea americana]